MTKADFIRTIKAGNIKLRLIGGDNYEWIKERRPQNLKARSIVKVQTNGFYFEGEENNGKGSWLELPPASLIEYNGKTLNIYNPGIREMNDEEKANALKADIERKRYEEANPYNDSFWHMKSFYKNCTTPWIYFGNGEIKGKKAAQGSDTGKIIDNSIKGNLVLQYAIETEAGNV